MKKVVEGKVYNTETAELIHSWDNGCYAGDFHACEETLYQTKKGAFFIHGSGGALSKYAVPVAGGTGGSDNIKPVTRQEASDWLEKHDGTDAIEEHFSDIIEEA